MSIFGRLVRPPAGGGVERRDLMSSAFVPPPSVGVIDDFVGVHRSLSHMTVLACVRLLADTIASLPWKAYRRDSSGIPQEVNPQPKLMAQPFPGFDLFSWKWMVVASMALRGNSYHYVTNRDKQGYPTALLPLHPDIVFLERRPDILLWFDPIYRIMGEAVPAEDMVHMRRFTLPGEPWGLSPIRQAAVAIGMGLSAEEYGYRFFQESANPSGILKTDQDLDEDAVKRQQQNWIASHGGRRLPAVLTGGFDFKTIMIDPKDSQFLETRQFQRSEICIMYGVPPILIGDTKETTAWGTGVAEINMAAVTYTFRAWTSCIESVISNCLPRGQFVRFDYNSLLRGNMADRYKALQIGINGGFLTPNEARAGEELDPLDGGNQLYLPNTDLPLNSSLRGPAAGTTGTPKDKPGKLPMPPTAGGENFPGKNGADTAKPPGKRIAQPTDGNGNEVRS